VNQKPLAGTWLSYSLPGHFEDDDFDDNYPADPTLTLADDVTLN